MRESRLERQQGSLEVWLQTVMVGAIRGYQRLLSPVLPPSCRFSPSCSQYMLLAIQKHGPLKGGLMGVWRIVRCNPFSKGGFDPVR